MSKSAAEKMTKSRTQLILKQPFFGRLAMRLKMQAVDWAPTAATDGVHLFYNPEFVESMTLEETKGMIAHEVMHCALLHFSRLKSRNPKLFNIAGDLAINPQLIACKYKLPAGVLLEPQYAHMETEAIYADLLKNARFMSLANCNNPDPGGCGGVIQPDSAPGSKPGKNSDAQGNGQQQPQEGSNTAAPQPSTETLESEWKIATSEALRSHGKDLGQQLRKVLEETLESKVDWRAVLAEFIDQTIVVDCDWNRSNRRLLSVGYRLPGSTRENYGEFAIGVDTSGSITPQDLALFTTEINTICDKVRPEKVHVIYCDAHVAHVDEFDIAAGDTVELAFHGGGGTNFSPVFEYLAEQQIEPRALIYFTDMLGPRVPSTPPYPVLWAATLKDYSKHGYGQDFGQVVYVER